MKRKTVITGLAALIAACGDKANYDTSDTGTTIVGDIQISKAVSVECDNTYLTQEVRFYPDNGTVTAYENVGYVGCTYDDHGNEACSLYGITFDYEICLADNGVDVANISFVTRATVSLEHTQSCPSWYSTERRYCGESPISVIQRGITSPWNTASDPYTISVDADNSTTTDVLVEAGDSQWFDYDATDHMEGVLLSGASHHGFLYTVKEGGSFLDPSTDLNSNGLCDEGEKCLYFPQDAGVPNQSLALDLVIKM